MLQSWRKQKSPARTTSFFAVTLLCIQDTGRHVNKHSVIYNSTAVLQVFSVRHKNIFDSFWRSVRARQVENRLVAAPWFPCYLHCTKTYSSSRTEKASSPDTGTHSHSHSDTRDSSGGWCVLSRIRRQSDELKCVDNARNLKQHQEKEKLCFIKTSLSSHSYLSYGEISHRSFWFWILQ